jgi:hypothetical protein
VLDYCVHFSIGDELEIRVWRKNGDSVAVRHKLVAGLNAIPIAYPRP